MAMRVNVNHRKTFFEKDLESFQIFNTNVPTAKCIAVCIDQHEGVLVDLEKRYNDIVISSMYHLL